MLQLLGCIFDENPMCDYTVRVVDKVARSYLPVRLVCQRRRAALTQRVGFQTAVWRWGQCKIRMEYQAEGHFTCLPKPLQCNVGTDIMIGGTQKSGARGS